MAFKIIVDYSSGDSFGTWDETKELGPWENLDIAKENLQRIEKHYKWAAVNARYLGEPEPERPDYAVSQYELNFLNDKNEDYKVHVSWVGYFETLQGAKITQVEEDGWSFRL